MTMKKIAIILSIFVLIASSCRQATKKQTETPKGNHPTSQKDSHFNPTEWITLKTTSVKKERKRIGLDGVGKAFVDWGDGQCDSCTFNYASNTFVEHSYNVNSTYTIIITGKNITHLNCWNQTITNLDVSNYPTLKSLSCGSNPLTSLDISKNRALVDLQCEVCQLKSLDISQCPLLEHLYCSGSGYDGDNPLTNLDVSKCPALEYLFCENNQLTDLDVSKCPALKELNCAKNQLIDLDVSKNLALRTLNYENNQIVRLNLSKNKMLTCVWANENNLSKTELNALFASLPRKTKELVAEFGDEDGYVERYINILGNPGASSCNRNIAEKKGWTVLDEEISWASE